MTNRRFNTIQKLIRSERAIWVDIQQAYCGGPSNEFSEMSGEFSQQWATILKRASGMLAKLGYTDKHIEGQISIVGLILLTPLPESISSTKTLSFGGEGHLDRWLDNRIPENCLISTELNSIHCDWIFKQISVQKSWHSAIILALAYMRLLEASLYLGAPYEGEEFRKDVLGTIDKFAFALIKKGDEALLFSDAKFKSAIGGIKGSRPQDIRWEKFALVALEPFKNSLLKGDIFRKKHAQKNDIFKLRYTSGSKEGEVRLARLTKLLEPDIFKECKTANLPAPGIDTIQDRLPKLLKQLNIKENIKIKGK